MGPAERPPHRARAHAARRHRRHLRSRPNVTADAGALCLKAGNAVILRGGSDSVARRAAIHACLVEGLAAPACRRRDPARADTDRAAVGEMLPASAAIIDVIVPRGGKSLVARVQEEARVPVFAHLEGICHVYVDRSADLDMAGRSPSTPRCAAPASAARPRRCSSTARSPARICADPRRADRRRLRDPRRRGRRRALIPRRSRRPKPTGAPNISTRSSR
jgi:hypothetical protein